RSWSTISFAVAWPTPRRGRRDGGRRRDRALRRSRLPSRRAGQGPPARGRPGDDRLRHRRGRRRRGHRGHGRPGRHLREDPPWAGPVAGLIAGLRALPESAEVVVVLPCDLPDLDADTLRTLLASLASAGSATSATLAVDPRGRDQYLLAAWDRRALTRRIAAIARRGGAPPP